MYHVRYLSDRMYLDELDTVFKNVVPFIHTKVAHWTNMLKKYQQASMLEGSELM